MQEVDIRINQLTCRLEFNTHKLGTNLKLEVEEELRDPSASQDTILESSTVRRTVSQDSLPLLTSSPLTSRESPSPPSSQGSESPSVDLQQALQGLGEEPGHQDPAAHRLEQQAGVFPSPEQEKTPAEDQEEDEEEYEPTITLAWVMNIAWTTGQFVEIRITCEDLEIHHERIKMTEEVSSHHSRVIPLRGEVFY